jgi:hypothetical protein
MLSILRSVVAVVVGLLAGFVVVAVGEMIGHHVAPPPPGLHHSNAESFAAAIEKVSPVVFVPVLLAWAVGTFAGSWVAARIASRRKIWHGLIVGGAFLAATIAILVSIPHPAWVAILGVVEPLAASYLGAKMAGPFRTKSSPVED